MSDIVLTSSLSPNECETRLRDATDLFGVFSWSGSRLVRGKISGRYVRICKRIGYHNSFQTFLSGYIQQKGDAAVFRGKCGIHPFVKFFMMAWFSFVLLIGGTIFFVTIRDIHAGGGQPTGLVMPPLMLVFGVMLMRIGRWLARNEEQFLIAYLAEVIEAKLPTEIERTSAADGT